MGTELGPNAFKVYQTRGSRRMFVGMIDPDLGLYQWAPGREGGSVANCSFMGAMSFGMEEWAAIEEAGVKRLEFKEGPTGLLYLCKRKRAQRVGRTEETPRGERFLVPLLAFKIVRDDTGEVIRKAEIK